MIDDKIEQACMMVIEKSADGEGGDAGARGKCSPRVAYPLFFNGEGKAPKARDLSFAPCSIETARKMNEMWHSRLPHTQKGPWQFAFAAYHDGVIYAVALWHNPSARTLPSHWLELRRMACAPDAPRNTASRFLAWMARYFRENEPEREKMISYQDTDVHHGTIYKASGWKVGRVQRARKRDRSKPRRGTNRLYRSSENGQAADASEKVRWEKDL